MANTILSVRDLRVNFSLRGKTLTAVRGASLDLYETKRSPSSASPAAARAC